VLMYPNSVRVEIRNDEVVAYRAGNEAVIVASDGTRYTPTDRGKVQRVVEAEKTEDEIAAEEDAAAAAALARGSSTAAPAPAAVTPPPEPVEASAGEREAWTHTPTSNVDTPAAADPDAQLLNMASNYAQAGKLTDRPVKAPPPWTIAASAIIGGLLRFGLALLMLRVATSWVGLPFFPGDAVKVAALYVVVFMGAHGLGGLGGLWPFIRIFRVDEAIGCVALSVFVARFKIATEGISVLKVTVTTGLATYMAMEALNFAIAFGFAAL